MQETILIGIGAQKAGTTWLAEYLRDHQQNVHFPNVKEVHFFDNFCMPNYGSYFEDQRLTLFKERIRQLSLQSISDVPVNDLLVSQLLRFKGIQSVENYIEFLNHGRDQQDILCDFTPDYALLDSAGFQLMKSVHPNIKLVFILRNPADRFWSSLRFNHTHNPEFDVDANFDQMLVRQDFVRFANYDRTIKAVYEIFDQEKVFVSFYENLFSEKTIRLFCDWLGVDYMPANFAIRSNPAVKGKMSELYRRRAVTAYQRTYREIFDRFNGDIPSSWTDDIETYLSH